MKKFNPNWIDKFDRPLIISGPCSAESKQQVMETAKILKKKYVKIFRAGIWKPRTKPGNFEGVGKIGLQWLQQVQKETNLMVATEVANAEHAKLALDHNIDLLWIGARSTVNPFTVQEIAESLKDTEKIILVKNPIHPDIDLWIGAIERFLAKGIKNLGVIHRGFYPYQKSKYRNPPNWQMAIDLQNLYPDIPIICDPSHICGSRDSIASIAKQALYFKNKGLMIETHINPSEAFSDSKQQLTPENLFKILNKILLPKNIGESQINLRLLRTQIDEIDSNIFALIYQRLKLSEKIAHLKSKHKIPTFQPERLKKIIDQSLSLDLDLSDNFIENFIELIHKESVNIQNKILLNSRKK